MLLRNVAKGLIKPSLVKEFSVDLPEMITIRKAETKDITAIAGFQQKMALETESLELDPEKLLSGVEAVLTDPGKGFYLVAVFDDKVVASTLLTSEWSDWRNGKFLWIQSVYVEPEYRKMGVYSKMYSFVKDIALNSPDYLGLRLYVATDNRTAQEVYKRTGMDGDHYKLFEWIK